MNFRQLIRDRRSVRSFDGRPLSEEDGHKIIEFARKLENPYDLTIDWQLLDGVREGLSSPVITGTDCYIAGKMRKEPHAEEAFGYCFEKVVLYACSLGVGTTWMAGTMDRKAFEKAMALADDEVMPAVSPLGYPAKKMSVRETLMRKGVKADSRLDFKELFFWQSFNQPLSREDTGSLAEALEAVRLAPSAVNRQPWRIVVCKDTVHFYEKPTPGMGSPNWDVQKIDMGIALSHFEIVARETGLYTSFVIEDPRLPGSEGLGYIASFKVEQ